MNQITWKIGGEAGFGIMIAGATLSKVLTRAGYHIIEINEYPSLIRGGHNVVAVTFSGDELSAPYKPVNLLVALNKETIDLHAKEMSDGSFILYDKDESTVDTVSYASKAEFLHLPMTKLVKEMGANVLMRNTVALGATLALFNVDFEILATILTQQFSKKGDEVVKQNVSAAKSGFDYIKQNYPNRSVNTNKPVSSGKHMTVNGAEAVALGAISAGMKFFACYPMTPINAILATAASLHEKMGFVYKQPEDEISGINMTIGASYAGVRAMTATSGGGFSLMVEGTSLAGMIEQPIVIIMGMRPGPATGLPTWTGQADLHFILNASQGEFPRLMLAPGDAEEAFYLTAEAFNLADRYQTPTFVLVDKYLCETRYSTPVFDTSKITIDRGKIVTAEEQAQSEIFPRFKLTEDGVSPRGIPGRKKGIIRANSDEHNEYGFSEESAENTFNMISKRMRKQYEANRHVPDPVVYGPKDANVTFVGWGSTKGAVLEALKYLNAGDGLKYNYLHLNYINPFPSEAVKRILESAQQVVDVEGNHNGQMADYILMKTGFKINNKILKFDGRPFYPEDVLEGVKQYVNAR